MAMLNNQRVPFYCWPWSIWVLNHGQLGVDSRQLSSASPTKSRPAEAGIQPLLHPADALKDEKTLK